jgi:hypothetical protein
MNSEKNINLVIRICMGVSIILVVFGIWEWIHGNYEFFGGRADVNTWGNYGSFLQGTTASVWALAGFFIIFVAFLIQNKQLVEQREQFRVQRDSISLQNFENTFFQLINLHHKLVEDMVEGSVTGRDCFKMCFCDNFRLQYWNKRNPLRSSTVPTLSPYQELKAVIESYDVVYTHFQGDLGHYFRNLYHILKFVDGSQAVDEKQKKYYVTLVRAQLSAYEQALLFYNCVHQNGEEFYIYIERYGLFHNLDDRLLCDPTHREYFAPSAFGTPTRQKMPNPRLERILNGG